MQVGAGGFRIGAGHKVRSVFACEWLELFLPRAPPWRATTFGQGFATLTSLIYPSDGSQISYFIAYKTSLHFRPDLFHQLLFKNRMKKKRQKSGFLLSTKFINLFER